MNRIVKDVKIPAELRPDKGEFTGSVIDGHVTHVFPDGNRVRFDDLH